MSDGFEYEVSVIATGPIDRLAPQGKAELERLIEQAKQAALEVLEAAHQPIDNKDKSK